MRSALGLCWLSGRRFSTRLWPTFLFQMVGVRREFSHAEGHVKSLVTRVLDRRHRTLADVPAPVFGDSRGLNVLEVRQKQVQLLPKEGGEGAAGTARGHLRSGRAPRTAAASGHCDHTQPLRLVEDRLHEGRRQPEARRDLRRGPTPHRDVVEHRGPRAHSRDPTWNTRTASTHAVTSCATRADAVGGHPNRRRCSARAATHGVYASTKTMNASAAAPPCPPEDSSKDARSCSPRLPARAGSPGSATA